MDKRLLLVMPLLIVSIQITACGAAQIIVGPDEPMLVDKNCIPFQRDLSRSWNSKYEYCDDQYKQRRYTSADVNHVQLLQQNSVVSPSIRPAPVTPSILADESISEYRGPRVSLRSSIENDTNLVVPKNENQEQPASEAASSHEPIVLTDLRSAVDGEIHEGIRFETGKSRVHAHQKKLINSYAQHINIHLNGQPIVWLKVNTSKTERESLTPSEAKNLALLRYRYIKDALKESGVQQNILILLPDSESDTTLAQLMQKV